MTLLTHVVIHNEVDVTPEADVHLAPNKAYTQKNLFLPVPQCPKGISADQLANVWITNKKEAKCTLEVTSQRRKHNSDSELSRNLSTNYQMLRYQRINSHFFTDSLFMIKKAKSTHGNTYMQFLSVFLSL